MTVEKIGEGIENTIREKRGEERIGGETEEMIGETGEGTGETAGEMAGKSEPIAQTAVVVVPSATGLAGEVVRERTHPGQNVAGAAAGAEADATQQGPQQHTDSKHPNSR